MGGRDGCGASGSVVCLPRLSAKRPFFGAITDQTRGEKCHMRAAVMYEARQPLAIENLEIAKPTAHEVLLRTAFTGLCHSDLHFMEGLYPMSTPCVLGH